MDGPTLLFEDEIDIGVPLSGHRLVPGVYGDLGLPAEAFLTLFAVREGRDPLPIRGPEDLSRLVTRIDTEDQAWRFLRLFTDPRTHYLFQRDQYTVDVEVTQGPVEIGTISHEAAARVGYRERDMRLEDDAYLARRDLARAPAAGPSAPVTILRRRESLSADGSYLLLDEVPVGEVSALEVGVPQYE